MSSNLEKRIERIEARNRKVELDKSWEISVSRRFLLVLFTYLAIGIYLSAINIENPWLNAIVPAFAFMLSTLTLPFFKKLWIKYYQKKSRSIIDNLPAASRAVKKIGMPEITKSIREQREKR